MLTGRFCLRRRKWISDVTRSNTLKREIGTMGFFFSGEDFGGSGQLKM